tara:strand:- start:1837 stop:2280 length:444 start_codon:yes stop_codon:yes gene_type:complete
MTIYDAIKKDHARHRELLSRIDDTSGDTAERRELFEEFRRELTAHANAEEQTLYAVLLENPDSQEQARHGIAEHKRGDDVLADLADLDFDNPGWLARFRKLRHEVEHHMDEEEEDVFASARQVLDDARAEEMAARFGLREAIERREA